MTAAYLQTLTATYRPWPHRWLLAAADAWTEWRAQCRHNAELRALAGLSEGTLHDIGLAHRVPARPTLGAVDYDRGMW